MNTPASTLDVDAIYTAALSALIGHPVRLVTLERPTGPITTVMPLDSRMRQDPFWLEVLRSPLPVCWPTPQQALVGFAASVATWVAASRRGGLVDPAKALLETLAGGPLPAADVYRSLAAAGFSHDGVDRAARRMGIVRRKAGMTGPWLWALPAEGSKQPSAIDRDQCTKSAKTADTTKESA